MVEHLLGLRLEKGHSAADWSTRPLPEAWLVYAALDVEVLRRAARRAGRSCAPQGKLEWAPQEFEAVRRAPPAAPRADPWRRTSGIHRSAQPPPARRGARALGGPRRAGRRRDIAPGRVLPDSAIVARRHRARTPQRADAPCRSSAAARRAGSRTLVRRALPGRRLAARTAPPRRSATGRRRRTAGPSATRPPPAARPGRAWPNWARRRAADAAREPAAARCRAPAGWTPPADGDVAGALRGGGARAWQVA